MWLVLLVLFAALSPGVLFTIPAMGKKMGGKVVIAVMHAILFVVIVNLLDLTEGFQVISKKAVVSKPTPEQSLARAETNMKSRRTQLDNATKKVAELTQQISSFDSQLATTQQELVAAQAAFISAQDTVRQKHTELADANKTVLDINVKMNMLKNKITSSSAGKGSPATLKRSLDNYNRSIVSLNKNIALDQKAIDSAKMAIAARDNVQKVIAQDATVTTSTGGAGSTQEMITEVKKVAQEMQVVAEKQLTASDAAGSAATGTGILGMLGLSNDTTASGSF